tara:strand:- start:291 stop:473 length:183 start_codon:yes stop_codon:yes gene_type:complete
VSGGGGAEPSSVLTSLSLEHERVNRSNIKNVYLEKKMLYLMILLFFKAHYYKVKLCLKII